MPHPLSLPPPLPFPPRPAASPKQDGPDRPHAEARHALRSRQLLAEDLTGGSGILRSPEASASTLLPYTATAKPRHSRFGALARLREREDRQREVRVSVRVCEGEAQGEV